MHSWVGWRQTATPSDPTGKAATHSSRNASIVSCLLRLLERSRGTLLLKGLLHVHEGKRWVFYPVPGDDIT